MSLQKKVLLGVTLIVVGTWLPAAGAGRGRPGCAPGEACTPKRMTYGYYPTTWRRWPTDQQGMNDNKKAPETVPTPAKAVPADSGDELPAPPVAPNISPSSPTTPSIPPMQKEIEPETAPSESLPSTIEPLPGGLEDGPPAPPSTSPADDEPLIDATPPIHGLPTEGPLEPPLEDATPKDAQPSSDDDPFKDEEPKSGDSQEESTPRPPISRRPKEKALGQHEPIRWRVTARSASSVSQLPAAEAVSADAEPQRLRTSNVDGDQAVLPVEVPRSNPYRSARVTKRSADGVVPTAAWTPVQTPENAAGGRRVNPFRSN